MIKKDDKSVELNGWVENVRNLGSIIFLTVRDINGTYQVTLSKDASSDLFDTAKNLRNESVVSISGSIKENKKAVNGWEVIPKSIDLLTGAEQPIPLNLNKNVESSLDKDIDYRFLSLRKEKISSVFKVESTVTNSVVKFFERSGFYQIHSSKIVSQATEGGANVFPVVYFDKTAYLAQSPQFYKQMMMAGGFEKVFEIGPVFRAEPHHTSRHLCEYTSIDIEMSFIKSYDDVMKVMEDMIINIYKDVEKNNKRELELLNVKLEIPRTPFPRITLNEAKTILKDYGKNIGDDIDPEGERILGQHVKAKYASDLFFLTEFPWSIAQFYHMRKDEDKSLTCRADLIYKGLEITTLAQREHRYEVLISQLKEKGLEPDKFAFYTDFFRYGIPPHGGSGTGLERVVKQMLNLDNIAEATLLPRAPDRLTP
ncbi:MAG: aspartate--tRNA(Asn) ligase [Candidatus Parvarchaeota archaeon]|nr:aspartate--tRNA(Asn) ligase [Candidatus Parvarchaeota archaeon]